MTTSVIQQKGLPKDYVLHIKGDSLVSQKWGETVVNHLANHPYKSTYKGLRATRESHCAKACPCLGAAGQGTEESEARKWISLGNRTCQLEAVQILGHSRLSFLQIWNLQQGRFPFGLPNSQKKNKDHPNKYTLGT